MNVEAAARVFHSSLRMHLIRYYLAHPGPQRDAVEALQVSQRSISTNTKELVLVGVLIEEPAGDRRVRVYRVDVERVRELLIAAEEFTIGPTDNEDGTPTTS